MFRWIQQHWSWRSDAQKPCGYSQACYIIGENHERALLKKFLGELDLGGVLIQEDAPHILKQA